MPGGGRGNPSTSDDPDHREGGGEQARTRGRENRENKGDRRGTSTLAPTTNDNLDEFEQVTNFMRDGSSTTAIYRPCARIIWHPENRQMRVRPSTSACVKQIKARTSDKCVKNSLPLVLCLCKSSWPFSQQSAAIFSLVTSNARYCVMFLPLPARNFSNASLATGTASTSRSCLKPPFMKAPPRRWLPSSSVSGPSWPYARPHDWVATRRRGQHRRRHQLGSG